MTMLRFWSASRGASVRAAEGNAYVLTDIFEDYAAEKGEYVVKPRDLPVYEIFECGAAGRRLCVRGLAAGERNGSGGE